MHGTYLSHLDFWEMVFLAAAIQIHESTWNNSNYLKQSMLIDWNFLKVKNLKTQIKQTRNSKVTGVRECTIGHSAWQSEHRSQICNQSFHGLPPWVTLALVRRQNVGWVRIVAEWVADSLLTINPCARFACPSTIVMRLVVPQDDSRHHTFSQTISRGDCGISSAGRRKSH